MKNNKSIFHPIKLVGALVFLMAFVLNIQTSLNGDWELVNVGFAQGTSGTGGGVTCPGMGTDWGPCHEIKCQQGGGYLVCYCLWTGIQANQCHLYP